VAVTGQLVGSSATGDKFIPSPEEGGIEDVVGQISVARAADEGGDERKLGVRCGMAGEKHDRVVDVARCGEHCVQCCVLEHRERVEHALELCGGEPPGVQGELLNAAQLVDG
jgi:hypothetical protein